MRLWIPRTGDSLRLDAPWTFDLHSESRNYDFLRAMVGRQRVTLPTGTRLIVDRLYVRQPATDYDSVTFVVDECADLEAAVGHRFWVKLRDANAIECTRDAEGNPIGIAAQASARAKLRDGLAVMIEKRAKRETAKAELDACRRALFAAIHSDESIVRALRSAADAACDTSAGLDAIKHRKTYRPAWNDHRESFYQDLLGALQQHNTRAWTCKSSRKEKNQTVRLFSYVGVYCNVRPTAPTIAVRSLGTNVVSVTLA